MKVLVVGARPGSLGAAVAETCGEQGWEVETLGISGDEKHTMDVVTASDEVVDGLMRSVRPDHVVCTMGVNLPSSRFISESAWWSHHFNVNVIGPMRLAVAFGKTTEKSQSRYPGHYVAVSSNSAHIPRTLSGPYCASKAALSMALRVAGREASGGDEGYLVYGYEPGLLAGTPMTDDVRRRLGRGIPLTRMRGNEIQDGLSVYGLAGHIVHNLAFGGPELNGCLLRYDAGEI